MYKYHVKFFGKTRKETPLSFKILLVNLYHMNDAINRMYFSLHNSTICTPYGRQRQKQHK